MTKESLLPKTAVRPATSLVERLFLPVDAASLAMFRIVFGALMGWSLAEQLLSGGVTRDFVGQPFHFSYSGFQWVKPLPGDGMYVVFGLLILCSLLLAVGFLYRLAAIAFTIGCVYVFLIDRAYYLNHEYLICLLGLLFYDVCFSNDPYRPTFHHGVEPHENDTSPALPAAGVVWASPCC